MKYDLLNAIAGRAQDAAKHGSWDAIYASFGSPFDEPPGPPPPVSSRLPDAAFYGAFDARSAARSGMINENMRKIDEAIQKLRDQRARQQSVINDIY